MGLSDCECGGFIALGPTASNKCDKCGAGVFSHAHEPEAPVIPIPDSELVRRAIANAKLWRHAVAPRWSAVSDAFGLGSTYAAQLCRDHGFDPDEELKRPGNETDDDETDFDMGDHADRP